MPLFRTILFAADFSERSKEAFRVACSLANEAKTRLIVLHVIDRSNTAERQSAVGDRGDSFGDREVAHRQALRDRLRDEYVPAQPIDLSYLLRYGKAAEEILCMATELGADLIVLGTHGRTGLRRLLAGSVAEAVLRDERCPVLALRSSERAPSAENLRVILHPTDFSECSESALEVARFLAREQGARLIVLYVAPIQIPINDTIVVTTDPQVYKDALRQKRMALDGLDLRYPVEALMKEGDTAPEIVAAAQETGSDLIVMGTCGRSGLGRLLMGSVCEGVLRRAHCPVLAVKMPVPAAVVTASASPSQGAAV